VEATNPERTTRQHNQKKLDRERDFRESDKDYLKTENQKTIEFYGDRPKKNTNRAHICFLKKRETKGNSGCIVFLYNPFSKLKIRDCRQGW
jgi:hypothetical protein